MPNSAIEKAEGVNPITRQLIDKVRMTLVSDSVMTPVAQGDDCINREDTIIYTDLEGAVGYFLQSYATSLWHEMVQLGGIFGPAPATFTLEEGEEVFDFDDIRWKSRLEGIR
jgi:hypothetical protein